MMLAAAGLICAIRLRVVFAIDVALLGVAVARRFACSVPGFVAARPQTCGAQVAYVLRHVGLS